MANEESSHVLDRWISSIGDWLNEQSWFQELKAKWDELDAQSRLYLKFAGGIGGTLLVLFTALNFIWSVHNLKKAANEKTALLSMLQSANEEMHKLKESSLSVSQDPSAVAWPNYLETVSSTAGLDKSTLTISSEKKGKGGPTATESLFDVALKHVNIKQVVRYAFLLENGIHPVKLRNLTIDTQMDPLGYVDATLAISGFTWLGNGK